MNAYLDCWALELRAQELRQQADRERLIRAAREASRLLKTAIERRPTRGVTSPCEASPAGQPALPRFARHEG